jgi:hypothetical protein
VPTGSERAPNGRRTARVARRWTTSSCDGFWLNWQQRCNHTARNCDLLISMTGLT